MCCSCLVEKNREVAFYRDNAEIENSNFSNGLSSSTVKTQASNGSYDTVKQLLVKGLNSTDELSKKTDSDSETALRAHQLALFSFNQIEGLSIKLESAR